MLDGLTLDQLRTFIAAADEGSFSAAGRRLRRAQSAISELISRLEAELGIALFDRRGRYPRLTAMGAALLTDARAVVGDIDFMRSRAKGMAGGIEPELGVVIDAMFPIDTFTELATAFRDAFPGTPLRIFVEALSNSFQPLLDRRASLGLLGPMPPGISGVTAERLDGVAVVMVASPDHALALHTGPISRQVLAKHNQLVLTDRSLPAEGQDMFVMAQSTWRLADLFIKRAFLLAGLGWGGMPRHAVADDLASGALVALELEDFPIEGRLRPMFATYRNDAPPGPAGRWMIERLKQAQGSTISSH
ncbi:MAG: LysR family transcriptional regulator [Sphingomicrobium sp.]